MKINKKEFRALIREALEQLVHEAGDEEKENKPENKPEPKEKPKAPEKPKVPAERVKNEKPKEEPKKEKAPKPETPKEMPPENDAGDEGAPSGEGNILNDRLAGQHIAGAEVKMEPNGFTLMLSLVGSKLPAMLKYTNDGRLLLSFKGQIYVLSQG